MTTPSPTHASESPSSPLPRSRVADWDAPNTGASLETELRALVDERADDDAMSWQGAVLSRVAPSTTPSTSVHRVSDAALALVDAVGVLAHDGSLPVLDLERFAKQDERVLAILVDAVGRESRLEVRMVGDVVHVAATGAVAPGLREHGHELSSSLNAVGFAFGGIDEEVADRAPRQLEDLEHGFFVPDLEDVATPPDDASTPRRWSLRRLLSARSDR